MTFIGQSLIGQPLTRREDPPLLTGARPVRRRPVTTRRSTLHAFFVRSPLAHAAITAIDVTEARAAEGVAAVYTAADLAELGVGPLPGGENPAARLRAQPGTPRARF